MNQAMGALNWNLDGLEVELQAANNRSRLS